MRFLAEHIYFPGGNDTAGRRLAFALAASLALHVLALTLDNQPHRAWSGLAFVPSLSVTLTDLKSDPRLAQSERVAPGEGGGNVERPGHAESTSAAEAPNAHVRSAISALQFRFEQSEELNLPTEHKVAFHGERAPLRGPRQARSEADTGDAERGGDACIVSGFYFCGGPGSEPPRQ